MIHVAYQSLPINVTRVLDAVYKCLRTENIICFYLNSLKNFKKSLECLYVQDYK
jgi:hypothetical protein